MKTRAILQTSPFKNLNGYWLAAARIGDAIVTVVFPDNPMLHVRDTITVERHGSEWRAV